MTPKESYQRAISQADEAISIAKTAREAIVSRCSQESSELKIVSNVLPKVSIKEANQSHFDAMRLLKRALIMTGIAIHFK